MRGWRVLALAGCVTLIVALCGSLSVGSLFWFGRTPTGASALGALGRSPGVNRLLVQSEEGNIFTIRPDGSDRLELTADAGTNRSYRQPTWSPSAERVAWVEVGTQAGQPESALLTSRVDGSEPTRAPTLFPPFYLMWSPDSTRVAYLSNWEAQDLALRLVDVGAGGDDTVMLGTGQPYYFSWAPDNQRLLVHVGNERLALLSLDGSQTAIDADPAVFPAPQWSQDGSQLVYAIREAGEQQLLLAGLDGEPQRRVTTFEGSISFSLSPDRNKIAYALTPRPIGTAAFGPLWLSNFESNQLREVSAEPVLAFFWSSDSQYLIFLRPERHEPVTPVPEASLVQQEQLWLRWHVWDGTHTYPLNAFSPSQTFLLEYLRFFDQYSQSMTPWAPDSSAFVYAGIGEDGYEGIWVQPVAEGSQPTRVVRGVYAAWSPK